MGRRVVSAAAVALLAGSVLPAAAGTPHGRGAGATKDVVASFRDPGAVAFTNPHPECPNSDHGGCAIAFDGKTVETGDLVGSTTYHGWLYPGAGPKRTFGWSVSETFTGRILGCGAGSLQWTGSGYGDVTTFSPSSRSAHMWGTLTIVPDSATRGLHGVTGSLDLDGHAYAVPLAAQDGTLKGQLSCDG